MGGRQVGGDLPADPPGRALPAVRRPRREPPGARAAGGEGRPQRRDDGQLPHHPRGRAGRGPRDVRRARSERRPSGGQRREPATRQSLRVARGGDALDPDRQPDRQPGGREPLGSLDPAAGDQKEGKGAPLPDPSRPGKRSRGAGRGRRAPAGGLGRLVLDLDERLGELESTGLHRRLRLVEGPQGPQVLLDGEPVLLLCSNNYLGLADHTRLRRAAANAALGLGTSAGASRLISGSMSIHAELEDRLAEFKGKDAALLFGSGYLANTGTIAALARRGDVVLSDELNHASIIDGCRLAGAETFIYRHGDTEHLEWRLRVAGRRAALIVTDGVFSMDGDIAPLEEICELARRSGCRVMVDEAHATGCIGRGGRGSVAAAGLSDEVDVIVGTLGKALGSYGAYVCGSRELADYLINTSRPFIFSTALPPPAVATAMAALELLDERPRRVKRLAANAEALREGLRAEGLEPVGSETQIVPVVIGEADDTMRLSERLLEQGIFAQAIRPPTVPAGTCRLRLTAMATHRISDLRRAAKVIGRTARELGLTKAAPAKGAPEPVPQDASDPVELPMRAPARPAPAARRAA